MTNIFVTCQIIFFVPISHTFMNCSSKSPKNVPKLRTMASLAALFSTEHLPTAIIVHAFESYRSRFKNGVSLLKISLFFEEVMTNIQKLIH